MVAAGPYKMGSRLSLKSTKSQPNGHTYVHVRSIDWKWEGKLLPVIL